MMRSRLRSFWIQAGVVLAVIIGVVIGDIVVAQAQIADNHRRAALKALHRAEAAYATKIDTISKSFYFVVQPVQDALDKLDVSQPSYLMGARDAVVNSGTSVAVSKLVTQVSAMKPPKTMVVHHQTLTSALKNTAKYLAALEKAKKAKDPADMLGTPYSTHAYSLSSALDSWYDTLVKVDSATGRATAPAPRPVGETRSKVKLPASKASWIFAADHVCSTAAHSMYLIKDPGTNASLATYAKVEDRYAAILAKAGTDLHKLAVPAADKRRLERGVYKALHANDQLVAAARLTASSIRAKNLAGLQDATHRFDLALKAIGTLSTQFRSYGAEHCGAFYDPHAKPTTKNGGGGTVSA
jgi:hypothetical protein